MPAIAIDIGTYSVKIAVGETGDRPTIKKAFELLNPIGHAVPMDNAQRDQLAGMMRVLWRDYAIPKGELRLSLPESVVSTKVIEMPPLSAAELASAIHWQAEKHIPIPKEELVLEYQVLSKPKKGSKDLAQILLIGVRRPLLERYLSIFENLETEPSLIETQSLSVFRALAVAPNDPPTIIAHLGASELIIIVVADGELKFVVSHLGGGSLLIKTLQESIKLEPSMAEQYVRAYGLSENQFGGKVRGLLLPHVNDWFKHIQLGIQYFDSHYAPQTVRRVIFSGSSVLLPGLVSQASTVLGCEILVADPFLSVNMSKNVQVTNKPAYSVVLGLLEQDSL